MCASLSFLQSAFASSQQLPLLPKFAAAKPLLPSFPIIEAKAKTRREDRTARHVRIRKKGCGEKRRVEKHKVIWQGEVANWNLWGEVNGVDTELLERKELENFLGCRKYLVLLLEVADDVSFEGKFEIIVEGTPERPRLCVFRSNKHLYVQVIDDSKMHTLASASTMQKSISEELDYSSSPTIEVAKKVGEVIASACLEKGITKVAFDRGGYPYHGRVKALADAAREKGLQF
ncbi:50S ribosomal protein L18, chloroplastic [Vitis vinifera]|uniref:Large ribosomal subunit protein uL18c n=1 Tax=Vitis vinifera TaxID=29760 RepID=A0A438KKW5_VITVI|nr:50S ribosomal protein L18, chloroplastic [Vitis vinifera]